MPVHPRPKPARLPAKLLQIRQQLRLGQRKLAAQLGIKTRQATARVSEYEHGIREPPLSVLLAYARIAKVCTCVLIDDNAELTSKSHRFRK
jgi:transcriptional regulator with XRE-family HTH domain